MTIHSVAIRATAEQSAFEHSAPARAGRREAGSDPARRHEGVREARLFQSQVADVARDAGVAAGTVYLYFKSKDDLLVSIFERT